MEIEVRQIGSKYTEVTIVYLDTRIVTGLLSQQEAKELGLKLIHAAQELIKSTKLY